MPDQGVRDIEIPEVDPGSSPGHRTRVVLAFGSNVGQREAHVLEAIRCIDEIDHTAVESVSSLYETSPVGVESGRSFINAVALIKTGFSTDELLKRLQMLESDLGRTGGHNAPREIDIDIISFGDVVLETTELTVPHNTYKERDFVLAPLEEIEPGFRCPATGQSVDKLRARLSTTNCGGDHFVRRVSGRKRVSE